MNKRTRIKTTLDSLFTGGKYSSNEPAAQPAESVKKPKSTGQAKKTRISKRVQGDDAPKTEQPAQKLVINPETPLPVKKPVEPTAVEPVIASQELPVGRILEKPVEETSMPQEKLTESAIPSTKPEKQSDEDQVQKNTESIDLTARGKREDEEQLVIFMLAQETYGVNIHAVESIIKLQPITEVPRSANFILGVTNLRGTVIPVLDLRKRFNMCPCENSANSRIIIVNAEGAKVGILVDEVDEVLKVSRDAIQPPPAMATTVDSAFINGIARIEERLIILLNLEKVLISSSRQYNRN